MAGGHLSEASDEEDHERQIAFSNDASQQRGIAGPGGEPIRQHGDDQAVVDAAKEHRGQQQAYDRSTSARRAVLPVGRIDGSFPARVGTSQQEGQHDHRDGEANEGPAPVSRPLGQLPGGQGAQGGPKAAKEAVDAHRLRRPADSLGDQRQADGMVDAGAQSDEGEAGGELPGVAGESRDRSASGGQEEEGYQQRLLAIAVAQPAGGYGADTEEHQADRGQRGQLLSAQAIEGTPDFRLDCREEVDVDMRHRVPDAREEQDVALDLLVAVHLFAQNFSR